jgi:predicted DNA-binding protein YlxM (UPF0122 family)
VWFDQATKERQRIEELFDFEDNDDAKDIGDTDSKPDNIVREVKPGSDDQGTDGLRNVRWAVDQTEVSSEWSSNSPRSSISESPEPENMSTKRKRRTVGQLLHQQASLVSSSDDEDSSVMDADDYSGFNTNPARTGNHALRDYHMRLMLLEQQNKKRNLLALQEQDNMAQSGFDGQHDISAGISPRPSIPAANGNHALRDYQMQLMLLEQQNKKRNLLALQEQDKMAQSGFDGQYDTFAGPDGKGNRARHQEQIDRMAEQEEVTFQPSSKLRAAMSYRRADGTQLQRHAAPKSSQEVFADNGPQRGITFDTPSKRRKYIPGGAGGGGQDIDD